MRKKEAGFTLLEVMVAIFVFTSGMMAFMSYHARANTMVFETESAQIAHSIAIDLAQEVSSLTPERFRQLFEETTINYGAIYQDSNIAYFNSFPTGPFDSWGKPLNGTASGDYLYYRMVKFDTYEGMTDIDVPDTSQLGRLRHFEVIVAWPLKGYGTIRCNSVGKAECNYLTIPIVKSVAITPTP